MKIAPMRVTRDFSVHALLLKYGMAVIQSLLSCPCFVQAVCVSVLPQAKERESRAISSCLREALCRQVLIICAAHMKCWTVDHSHFTGELVRACMEPFIS